MLLTIILCTLIASIFNGIFYFLASFFLLKRTKELIKKGAQEFEKIKNSKKEN